jgi:hypothetical protein
MPYAPHQQEINVGLPVYSQDGEHVGTIVANYSSLIIVERGVFIKYLCSFATEAILRATSEGVYVAFTLVEIQQPWHIATLTDAAGQTHTLTQIGIPIQIEEPTNSQPSKDTTDFLL